MGDASRRQLDRQRQARRAGGRSPRRPARCRGQREVGAGRLRSLHEEPHGVDRGQVLDRAPPGRAGPAAARRRRARPTGAAARGWWRAPSAGGRRRAGGRPAAPPPPPARSCRAPAAGAGPAGHRPAARGAGGPPPPAHPGRVASAGATRSGSASGVRSTKATPSANSPAEFLGDAQGEAGLADAAGTGQRHQAHVLAAQEVGDGGDLALPTDERGGRGGRRSADALPVRDRGQRERSRLVVVARCRVGHGRDLRGARVSLCPSSVARRGVSTLVHTATEGCRRSGASRQAWLLGAGGAGSAYAAGVPVAVLPTAKTWTMPSIACGIPVSTSGTWQIAT